MKATPAASVRAITTAHPRLTIWGYGQTTARHLSPAEFAGAREDLNRPATVESITSAAEWITSNLEPRTKPSPRDRSTYGWKHDYERATGRYIENGAFTVAVVLAGIPVTMNAFNPMVHAKRKPRRSA